MMFLFHQLYKRHGLQYPQIRDVAMNISGHVAQGVRSPSQSPQPNNNRGDQHDSAGIRETLTGANTEPIVKRSKEVTFPQPVSASVKDPEPDIETQSNNSQKSCKEIKTNMKSSVKIQEIKNKNPSTATSKAGDNSISSKIKKSSPDSNESKDETRTDVDASTANKEKDENGNGDGTVEVAESVEPNELETWKDNYKELQEKCRDISTRLQNEVQATKNEVAGRDMIITEKSKTIQEKETENKNLKTDLEETQRKYNEALSQCKQFFENSQKEATVLKEREARIKELEERLAGRSGSAEEVIIKKEVGAEEQENVKLRKEIHELTKRLRIIEVFSEQNKYFKP